MCTQLSTIKLIIAPPIPPKNLLQQQKHHPQTNPNKKNTESPFDCWTWGEVKGREMSCWRVGLVTAARAPYCLSSDTPAVHGTQAEEGDRSQICNQKAEEKHFKHTFCSWLLWNTSKGNCIAGCKKKKITESMVRLSSTIKCLRQHNQPLKASWLPGTSGATSQ